VNSDDATLVEALNDKLLRATFSSDDSSRLLLIATLLAEDPRHRVLALRGLVRRGDMNEERWLAALDDPAVEVRRDALEQLAHASEISSRMLDTVVQLLDSEDDLVVDAAVFALGEHAVVDAVEPLCRVATGHDDARCRESAIAALGSIGDDRARAVILAALDDKPAVRRRAVVALSNFEGPDIEEALAAASEDRDWQVRSAVDQLRRD
jgi:HEAT repeat protein